MEFGKLNRFSRHLEAKDAKKPSEQEQKVMMLRELNNPTINGALDLLVQISEFRNNPDGRHGDDGHQIELSLAQINNELHTLGKPEIKNAQELM